MMKGQQCLLLVRFLVQVHWRQEQGIKGDRDLLDLYWWMVVVMVLVLMLVFHDGVCIRGITRKRINIHLDSILHRWLSHLGDVMA